MTKNPCKACTLDCGGEGCNAWRKWWVQSWNRNIHRYIPPMPRQMWQYEHPDRVREMAPKNPEEMTATEWLAMQMGAKKDA